MPGQPALPKSCPWSHVWGRTLEEIKNSRWERTRHEHPLASNNAYAAPTPARGQTTGKKRLGI